MESASDCNVIVKVLSTVLSRLIESNDQTAAGQHLITKFQSSYTPEVSIYGYLERIKKYARCSDCCFVIALIYIDRLIEARNVVLTKLNVHRLIITSLMLSAKFFDDLFYNNAFYAKLGGVTVVEINSLELELLSLINFSLYVSSDQYDKYQCELQSYASSANVPANILPVLSENVQVMVQAADGNTQAWFDACTVHSNSLAVSGVAVDSSATVCVPAYSQCANAQQQLAAECESNDNNPFADNEYALVLQQSLIGIRCARVDSLFSSGISNAQQVVSFSRTTSPEDRLLGHYPQISEDTSRTGAYAAQSQSSALVSVFNPAHVHTHHQLENGLWSQNDLQLQQTQQQFRVADDYARAYAAAAAMSAADASNLLSQPPQGPGHYAYMQNNQSQQSQSSFSCHKHVPHHLQLQIYDSPTGHLELAQALSARSYSGSGAAMVDQNSYFSPLRPLSSHMTSDTNRFPGENSRTPSSSHSQLQPHPLDYNDRHVIVTPSGNNSSDVVGFSKCNSNSSVFDFANTASFGHAHTMSHPNDHMQQYSSSHQLCNAYSAPDVNSSSMQYECGSTADLSLRPSMASMSSVSSSLSSMANSVSQRSFSQAALYPVSSQNPLAVSHHQQQQQQQQHAQMQMQFQPSCYQRIAQCHLAPNVADTDALLSNVMDSVSKPQYANTRQFVQQQQQPSYYEAQDHSRILLQQQQQQMQSANNPLRRQQLHDLHQLQQQYLAHQQQECRLEAQRRNCHQLFLNSQPQSQCNPQSYHQQQQQLNPQPQQPQYCYSDMTPVPTAKAGNTDDLKRSSAYFNMASEYRLAAGAY